MIFLIVYFIIGFGTGLFIYDYHCKDFNKRNRNRQFKLTWEEYSVIEGPGLCMAFAIFMWPLLLLIAICYYMSQYLINQIKKRNGI